MINKKRQSKRRREKTERAKENGRGCHRFAHLSQLELTHIFLSFSYIFFFGLKCWSGKMARARTLPKKQRSFQSYNKKEVRSHNNTLGCLFVLPVFFARHFFFLLLRCFLWWVCRLGLRCFFLVLLPHYFLLPLFSISELEDEILLDMGLVKNPKSYPKMWRLRKDLSEKRDKQKIVLSRGIKRDRERERKGKRKRIRLWAGN